MTKVVKVGDITITLKHPTGREFILEGVVMSQLARAYGYDANRQEDVPTEDWTAWYTVRAVLLLTMDVAGYDYPPIVGADMQSVKSAYEAFMNAPIPLARAWFDEATKLWLGDNIPQP